MKKNIIYLSCVVTILFSGFGWANDSKEQVSKSIDWAVITPLEISIKMYEHYKSQNKKAMEPLIREMNRYVRDAGPMNVPLSVAWIWSNDPFTFLMIMNSIHIVHGPKMVKAFEELSLEYPGAKGAIEGLAYMKRTGGYEKLKKPYNFIGPKF